MLYESKGKAKRKPIKNRRPTPAPHVPSNKTVAKYAGLAEGNPTFTPGGTPKSVRQAKLNDMRAYSTSKKRQ